MAVFTALRPHNPLPASQAQGYPPLVTSTPTPVSLSGYPGPAATYPIQTATPLSFTVSHNNYIPITVSNLPLKKGMVWNYYGLTNMDPWNVMNIGWFYRYGPSASGAHGPITHIPFWPCSTLTVAYMLTKIPAGYDGYFMWLNEPNTGHESGCPPMQNWEAAANFYIEVRLAYPYAKFIGPHTYHGSPEAHAQAMNWVNEWREAVKNHPLGNNQYPDVAGYGIHPYSTNKNQNEFFVDDYYGQMIAWGEGNKELWVTEFTYCNLSTMADDLEYTVNAFETRTYVDRYAYWVDWRPTPTPTPTPTPIGTPTSTATPGANDGDSENDTPLAPMAVCVEPATNTIALFTGDGYNVLTQAGEIYRYLGR
ncbi:MAG: glycoside hydrolase family protein [Anaerolineae bacterium]|nr:glycoside hydrolase family protein [Anaerolineae bacterium]